MQAYQIKSPRTRRRPTLWCIASSRPTVAQPNTALTTTLQHNRPGSCIPAFGTQILLDVSAELNSTRAPAAQDARVVRCAAGSPTRNGRRPRVTRAEVAPASPRTAPLAHREAPLRSSIHACARARASSHGSTLHGLVCSNGSSAQSSSQETRPLVSDACSIYVTLQVSNNSRRIGKGNS